MPGPKPRAIASVQRRPSPARKRTTMPAQAVFYDDSPVNFMGSDPRFIHTIHCKTPITVQQLKEARNMYRPGGKPTFFFFDFDNTLSVQAGLDPDLWNGVESFDEVLAHLFGDEERQLALSVALGDLLRAGVCYVLTANQGYNVIAWLLNKLLEKRGSGGGGGDAASFVTNGTVLYAQSGSKIRRIQKVVQARGHTFAA